VINDTTGDADRTERTPEAKAQLKDAKGQNVGNATFTEMLDGVNVVVKVSGISPGQHGIHIHQAGSCEDAAFKSAGAHFNPSNQQHGSLNPQGMHVGDLENIHVSGDGTGTLQQTIKRATLTPGQNSLLREGGTSVVLHAAADDLKTDPSGGSGDRIACGVIEH